jgi:dTDP-4-amino-4,6-dideoxygalactose transaminase
MPAMIVFNRPYLSGRELAYIRQAHAGGHLSGNGPFTKKCEAWLRRKTGSPGAFLTHSCTAALEMAAILLNIRPGDEILMPSFAFVSTANAFVLRGGVPVFVDIRPDTLNLDETLLEKALTKKTKAIVAVHYGGISCEMEPILRLARRRGLAVIEDAAQGILCSYKGRALGSMGDLGAYSFHETKSITSGEGGALLVNGRGFLARAEVLREKGTDRARFLRGLTDKYTWRDIGSSYLPSDIVAAFLWAQLESARSIIEWRMRLWRRYHEAFEGLEREGRLRRPVVPAHSRHNAHLYYLLLPDRRLRPDFLREMECKGIHTVFHYVPLHRSPAGRKYGRVSGPLRRTDELSGRLVRMPLWVGMGDRIERVIDQARKSLRGRSLKALG